MLKKSITHSYFKEICTELEPRLLGKRAAFDIYGHSEKRQQPSWRTLVADRFQDHDTRDYFRWPSNDPRLSITFLLDRATLAQELLHEAQDALPELLQFERASLACMVGRRMLSSRNGYFGMGPAATMPGDLIAVYLAMPMPFVVRKRPELSTYCLIGPAYVHGIIDDEAMLGLQEGKYVVQDFTLD